MKRPAGTRRELCKAQKKARNRARRGRPVVKAHRNKKGKRGEENFWLDECCGGRRADGIKKEHAGKKKEMGWEEENANFKKGRDEKTANANEKKK